MEIAALPAFVPVSLRAPTTSPTQPVGDDARAVPVRTKIVLEDEEDRRIVLALRRRSAGGAERETARRVMGEVAIEMGMRNAEEVGEHRLGDGMAVYLRGAAASGDGDGSACGGSECSSSCVRVRMRRRSGWRGGRLGGRWK